MSYIQGAALFLAYIVLLFGSMIGALFLMFTLGWWGIPVAAAELILCFALSAKVFDMGMNIG